MFKNKDKNLLQLTLCLIYQLRNILGGRFEAAQGLINKIALILRNNARG